MGRKNKKKRGKAGNAIPTNERLDTNRPDAEAREHGDGQESTAPRLSTDDQTFGTEAASSSRASAPQGTTEYQHESQIDAESPDSSSEHIDTTCPDASASKHDERREAHDQAHTPSSSVDDPSSASVEAPPRHDSDTDAETSPLIDLNPSPDDYLDKMRYSSDKLAERPGFGQRGKSIKLIANHFELKLHTESIFHYDIDIKFLRKRKKDKKEHMTSDISLKKGQNIMKTGRTAKEDAKRNVTHVEHQQKRAPGKKLCRKIFTELIRIKCWNNYNPVYDGQKNMYTTETLDIKEKEIVTVTLDEEDAFCDFEVIVKPVIKEYGSGTSINLEQIWEVLRGRSNDLIQEILMVYDTVFCHREFPFLQVQVGRSFFMIDQTPHNIGKGLEIWFGYKQSVRLTRRGPVLIVDFTAKAFHEPGPLIKYASKVLKFDVTKNLIKDKDVTHLNEAIKELKIVREIPRHMKTPLTILKLGKTASEIRFEWNKEDITVADYYSKRYGYTLKYKHLPCVQMKPPERHVYLPMELCTVIEHQPHLGKKSKKRDAFIQREMIKKTAIEPVKRFREIDEAVQEIQNISGKAMNRFGLQLKMHPMHLTGRVLELPMISYKNPNYPEGVKPDDCGRWSMKNIRFLKSAPMCSWVLFNFSEDITIEKLKKFVRILEQSFQITGMNLERVKAIQSFDSGYSVREVLRLAKFQYKVKLAVVVLPKDDNIITYEEVKFIGDIELRLLTQCMTENVVENFKPSTAHTLLPKLNTKLGGSNHMLLQRLPFFNKPIIVFGADATHYLNHPSIAAVVGSLDAYPSQYAVTCRVQENPKNGKISQEIILDLDKMCKDILRRFICNTHGKQPERIIFFRDGVSEGQFGTVLREEVSRIRDACNEVMTGYLPPITYVVVQRTHMARFKPQNTNDGVGRMRNMPPGTVIDTDVTHPFFYDFYLCSHEGIQGTSKAAHYVVILDENGFSVDDLQKVCYHLCYLYSRCNRSVAMPPPVMYADLACTRARSYADHFINSDSSSTSSAEKSYPPNVVNAINNLMGTFGETMFYI